MGVCTREESKREVLCGHTRERSLEEDVGVCASVLYKRTVEKGGAEGFERDEQKW